MCMRLYVDLPGCGLPSIVPESLAAIALCQITIPRSFTIDYTATEDTLICGTLPSLHDEAAGIWLHGLSEIQRHLGKCGFGFAGTLSKNASAEAMAYAHLLRSSAYDLVVILS